MSTRNKGIKPDLRDMSSSEISLQTREDHQNMIRQSKQRKEQAHKKQQKKTKWKIRSTPPTEDEIREVANCLYNYPKRKTITFKIIRKQAETQLEYTFEKRERTLLKNRLVELNNFYESPSTKAPAAETPTTSTKEPSPKVTPTKPKFPWDSTEEGSEVNVDSSGAEEDDTTRDQDKKPSSHRLTNTTSHALQEDESKDCTPKKQSLESSSSSSDSDNFPPNKKNLGSGNDLSDSDPEECTFTDHPKNDSSDNSHLSDPRRRLEANSDGDDYFIDNRSSSSMTHYGQASDSSFTG